MQNNESLSKSLKVFFIGIGGVSMSSLAIFMKNLGLSVGGSDITRCANTYKLEEMGIDIFYYHSEKNVKDYDVIIYNSAISQDNVELKYSLENNKYVLSRAELLEMLSETYKTSVGVAGCHGKTTVTCMLAHVLFYSKFKFGCHVGGYDKKFSNSFSNGRDVFITEVCEYKKNILKFTPHIAVVLNIDNDHLDCYENIEDIKNTYFKYLNCASVKIICGEDKYLNSYIGENVITYGYNSSCNYYSQQIERTKSGYEFLAYENGKRLGKFKINVFGLQNVLNALSVIACARQLKVDVKSIKKGLESFDGVKRRFETIGSINNAKVICDYAHHPKEIISTLRTCYYSLKGKLFVVFQPHTYSRTKLLMNDFVGVFEEVENLIIYKTFSAREQFDSEGDAELLAKNLNKQYFDNFENLYSYLLSQVKSNDIILVLGAGDIYDLFLDKM